jgi:SAM-dependent methyltransferase
MTTQPTGNPKGIVAEGYDRIAEGYLARRGDERPERDRPYLDRVTEGLDGEARVLDLGCGAGIPVAAYLSERFRVVGLDISRHQLSLARGNVRGGTFLLGDMCSLPFQPESFDAVVALYSIFHVPREEHEALLGRVRDVLRPGRRLLATMGKGDWEGGETDWLGLGAEMYWSHFGADTNLELMQRAGFRVLASQVEPDTLDGEHLFVLAEKTR